MSNIEEILKKIAANTSRESSPISSSTDPRPNGTKGAQVDLSEIEERLKADLPGDPNCPVCGGKGYIRQDLPVGHPDFGRVKVCGCRAGEVAQAVHRRLFQFSNLQSLAHLTFENFDPRGKAWFTEEQQTSVEAAFKTAKLFADHLEGWLVIRGGFGCGKTHLAAAIANQAVGQGVDTLFLTVPDLLDWLRFSYGASAETSYEQRFEEIRTIGLLVMDDFGTHNATPWAQEKLFQILNYRYINRLPLVMTSNVDFRLIEGRIRSRLEDRSMVDSITVSAPDYRKNTEEIKQSEFSTFHFHKDKTFDSFDFRNPAGMTRAEHASLENAFKAGQEYARHPDGWLVFTGPFGCGKTHLAAAIGNALTEQGKVPVMLVVSDLLDHLRSTYSPNSMVTLDQRFEDVRDAEILILDDLGAQSATPWAKEKLFQLINYRYIARLPTIITTSLKLEDIDERIQTRLLDRRLVRVQAIVAPDYHRRREGVKKSARQR